MKGKRKLEDYSQYALCGYYLIHDKDFSQEIEACDCGNIINGESIPYTVE